MSLFKIASDTLLQDIKETKFDLERDLQKLVEKNLDMVFGLTFISSEFALHNFRIDTLAFDEESKAFVIIEYKRDSSFSVIDQGYSYLGLLLNNKADFVLHYMEKTGKVLRKDDIDWSQSRVIFVAHNFTAYQRNALNFRDIAFELWEAKKYEGNLVSLDQVKPAHATESIKTVQRDKEMVKISNEIKNYSVEDHLLNMPATIQSMFEELREGVLSLDSAIEEHPTKNYIAYKMRNRNMIGVYVMKSKIMIEFQRTLPEDLRDSEKKLYYRKDSMKHFHQHISLMDVYASDDLEYAMMLIRQVKGRYV